MRKIEHYSPGHFKPPLVQKTWNRTALPCHCLIIYENEKVILVDCGMHPEHLGSQKSKLFSRSVLGAQISNSETMKSHLDRQGVAAGQVTDILITHLHYDHSGGLSDFPQARVHLHETEWNFANQKTDRLAKNTQFVASSFAHVKSPELYSQFQISWQGFEATNLRGLSSDILMISLPGHSPGHCGYVIPAENEIIFHVGDAFFVTEDLDSHLHNHLLTSEIFQIGLAYNAQKRMETIHQINRLLSLKIPGLKVVNSHDERLLRDGLSSK